MNAQAPLLPAPPESDTERAVSRLIGLLAGNGWMTAAKLMRLEPAWCERTVRALANASSGAVLSFPGSPGYHLTVEASAEDRERAVAKLRHQALAMGDRANSIAHVHHRCPRPAATP